MEVFIKEEIKKLIEQFDTRPDFVNNPRFAVRILLDVLDELYPDDQLTKSACKQKQSVIERMKYIIPTIATVEKLKNQQNEE